MDLFNPNSRLFSLLSRTFDLVTVNFLFLVTSLPVFTIGASMAALHRVTQQIVSDDPGSIAGTYFRTWFQCFRQATCLWLLLLPCLLFLIGDWVLLSNAGGILRSMRVVVPIVLCLVFSMTVYSFQLICRFENTVLGTLRNALLLTFGHLPCTLLLLVVPLFIVGMLLLATPVHASILSFFLLFLGAGLYSLLCSFLSLRWIFPKHHTSADPT